MIPIASFHIGPASELPPIEWKSKTRPLRVLPTSDFGFQFIEALVAAGITGGTGGGNYSPDAPVTRRQMAIFIAKALGIYSPLY